MPTETNPRSQLDLESRILRALCNDPCNDPPPFASPPTADAAARASILAKLRTHRWQNPEHRVVFEALTLLPGRQAKELREQLPAQATRMGFPDVNWDQYFAANADHIALEAFVAELLAASRPQKS
jgi:hypothetical protein